MLTIPMLLGLGLVHRVQSVVDRINFLRQVVEVLFVGTRSRSPVGQLELKLEPAVLARGVLDSLAIDGAVRLALGAASVRSPSDDMGEQSCGRLFRLIPSPGQSIWGAVVFLNTPRTCRSTPFRRCLSDLW